MGVSRLSRSLHLTSDRLKEAEFERHAAAVQGHISQPLHIQMSSAAPIPTLVQEHYTEPKL